MTGERIKLLACAAVAAFASAAPALAQQAPATAAAQATSADATSQDEEIVVRADGDQVRIDRRVYAIRNDPIAQATDMFDVLGRIPSVSVDPSGGVTLLGAGSPQIQINGQPIPQNASPEQVLRGIQGADVERIEVITNPSAAYSSATSSGIINIITRRRLNAGLSGNASVTGDSFGSNQGNFAPSWSHDVWTLAGRLNYYDYQSDGDFLRTRRDLGTGDVTVDDGRNDFDFQGLGGNLDVSYQLDTKNKGTVSFESYSGSGDADQFTDSSMAGLPLSRQQSNSGSAYNYNGLSLHLQHDGDKSGEQLRFDAELWQQQDGNDNAVTLDPVGVPTPSAFLSRSTNFTEHGKTTIDYDLPVGEKNILSIGVSAETNAQHISDLLRLLSPSGTPDAQSSLVGREQTLAAYGTYQLSVGDWLLQPGVRAEDYRREVTSAGGATDTHDLRAFPTIHARRSFQHIDIDLSYTSRIDRPDLGSLDPAVNFSDATHAQAGNPDLHPSTVDAYEANFTYQQFEQTVAVTFFDRIHHDVTASLVTQVGDVTLFTQTNAGDREERGLQTILRGKLGPRWYYAVSANALDKSFDTLRNGVFEHDNAFEYYGNASIEYRDRDQTRVGANDIQFDVRFNGPTHSLQYDTDAWYFANLSWRRRLTDHLYGFLQVSDMFASLDRDSLTHGDDFIERTTRESPGARIRLSLTYQFGNAVDHPPPPPSEGGGGPQQ
jgi:outer membrane cobalamin receptor